MTLAYCRSRLTRVGIYFPSSAELRKRHTIQTGLCVLSLVLEVVGFSVITCERGEALYNDEKATQGTFLFIHREATQMCMQAIHAHTHMKSGVGEGRQEVVQEVIMVLKNTALVSTALTNLCWDIPNFLPEQKSTHKHTTVCIYADEHT